VQALVDGLNETFATPSAISPILQEKQVKESALDKCLKDVTLISQDIDSFCRLLESRSN